MNRLLEQLAVLLLCLPGFFLGGAGVLPVVAFLVAVAVSASVQLLSGKKAGWVILFLGAAACGLMPVLLCALPLFFYNALSERRWWLVVPAITVLLHPPVLSAEQLIITGIACIVALILNYRINGLEKSVYTLQTLRDDITEKNLQLAEQNKKIFHAQDNEVHLATLKERNRIAREIHDNVGHMLTRSILQTGALQVINRDENLKEPLAALKTTLDGAMTSIRASVHDLHDESFDLKRALTELSEAAQPQFTVNLQYDASEYIPGEIKLCVAGIVKEGVSNAVKHSGGDRIDIIFREHPAFYQLLLTDNGTGSEKADGSDANRRGIGLKNMEDRAASVGGAITFTPSAQGFRIFMTIPKKE